MPGGRGWRRGVCVTGAGCGGESGWALAVLRELTPRRGTGQAALAQPEPPALRVKDLDMTPSWRHNGGLRAPGAGMGQLFLPRALLYLLKSPDSVAQGHFPGVHGSQWGPQKFTCSLGSIGSFQPSVYIPSWRVCFSNLLLDSTEGSLLGAGALILWECF